MRLCHVSIPLTTFPEASDSPASTQKKPIKPKYPPITGMGKKDTNLANLARPMSTSTRPKVMVPIAITTREVATMVSGSSPSRRIAMSVAILDRKIRPASCTRPIAKGIVERTQNEMEWIILLKSISFARLGMNGW